MKKKIISLLAATAMLTACALPVCADDYSGDASAPITGDTTVTYSVGSTYTVSIPKTINLSNEKTAEIKLTAANITGSQTVDISTTDVNAAGAVELKNGDVTATSAITLSGNKAIGAKITSGVDFASFKAVDDKVVLTFGDVEGATNAGTYTGTMNFSVELK